jgi:acyl-CoA thioesterase II
LPAERATRAMLDGSQVLGQGLVAASRSTGDRFVKSAHMIFARPASGAAWVDLTLDPLHAGRSFGSVSVSASQAGRECARGLYLMDADPPDFVHHATAMPEVAAPDASTPVALPVRDREVRLADGRNYADPADQGPPRLHVWVRHAAPPSDRAIAQALLAHFCGFYTIGVAMRPHPGIGEALSHRSLSTGVLSLTVHFHEPCSMEGWLLYAHDVLHAGRGACTGTGRVFEQSGRLVASFALEGMLRALDPRAAKVREAERL